MMANKENLRGERLREGASVTRDKRSKPTITVDKYVEEVVAEHQVLLRFNPVRLAQRLGSVRCFPDVNLPR